MNRPGGESCGSCRFFDNTDTDHECWRHPEQVHKEYWSWCGDWQKAPDGKVAPDTSRVVYEEAIKDALERLDALLEKHSGSELQPVLTTAYNEIWDLLEVK